MNRPYTRIMTNIQQTESPAEPATAPKLPAPVFHDPKHHIKIYQGGCLEILPAIPENCVDLIFADPPYFLSNDGITCHAGRMVSVNKGQWDRSRGEDSNLEFVWMLSLVKWLGLARSGGVLGFRRYPKLVSRSKSHPERPSWISLKKLLRCHSKNS